MDTEAPIGRQFDERRQPLTFYRRRRGIGALLPESTITLKPAEKKLLAQIAFGGEQPGAAGAMSREAAGKLMKSLFARRAVPEVRLRYFTDPELNVGGRISRREQFERNGTRGNDIFTHPHFLKYLRYFLFGPDLPAETISAFTARVRQEDFISGSDISELCGIVRQQTRQHSLAPSDAAEEFFKLAIECDIDSSTARQLRDTAKKVRK